jgi:hypothetical protein
MSKTVEEIFEELHTEYPIEEMVKFDETDIQEKLQDNIFLLVQFKELYYGELDTYEELERKMDALRGKRYKHYKFDVEEHWEKKEIEDYCLPADVKIIAMKKIMKKQKIKVRFFEMAWKAFDKLSWNMKQFNDRDRRGI